MLVGECLAIAAPTASASQISASAWVSPTRSRPVAEASSIKWHPTWPPPPNTMILDFTATPWLSARHLYERRLGLRKGCRLVEGFAGEEPDPHLPQHERQDGKERNNSENFTEMQRHDPSLCLAPNLEAQPGSASAPIARLDGRP